MTVNLIDTKVNVLYQNKHNLSIFKELLVLYERWSQAGDLAKLLLERPALGE